MALVGFTNYRRDSQQCNANEKAIAAFANKETGTYNDDDSNAIDILLASMSR